MSRVDNRKFHGMKPPKEIQFWKAGNPDMVIEQIEPKNITPIDKLMVNNKSTKGKKRPFNVQPIYRIRGYRIEKPEVKDNLFTNKYSRAITLLCCAVFDGVRFTDQRGAKIEGVR